VAFVLVAGSAGRHVKRGLALAAAAAVPIVLMVGGWQLRNHARVDSFRFAGVEALTMYEYRAGGVIAQVEGRPFVEVRAELRDQYPDRRPGEEQGPYYERMWHTGFDIVKAHPAVYARVMAEGGWSEVFGIGRTTVLLYFQLGHSSVLAQLARVGLVLFYVVMVIGIVATFRRPGISKLVPALALLVVAYVIVASAGPEAYARMRAPVMPLLCCFAAAGAARIEARLARQ
jgi:hypothetical protein